MSTESGATDLRRGFEDHRDGTSILYLIKQVELAVRSHLENTVRPYGLTSVQYTALSVLERHPGVTSAALARNSFVRTQTMAQMTSYLLEAGLIRKERDSANGRQHLLYLTERGQEVVGELREPVRDLEDLMTSELTRMEVGQLRAALRACRRVLGEGPVH